MSAASLRPGQSINLTTGKISPALSSTLRLPVIIQLRLVANDLRALSTVLQGR